MTWVRLRSSCRKMRHSCSALASASRWPYSAALLASMAGRACVQIPARVGSDITGPDIASHRIAAYSTGSKAVVPSRASTVAQIAGAPSALAASTSCRLVATTTGVASHGIATTMSLVAFSMPCMNCDSIPMERNLLAASTSSLAPKEPVSSMPKTLPVSKGTKKVGP